MTVVTFGRNCLSWWGKDILVIPYYSKGASHCTGGAVYTLVTIDEDRIQFLDTKDCARKTGKHAGGWIAMPTSVGKSFLVQTNPNVDSWLR
jgi:hypothetical protein